MTRINLLPWREAERRRRQREFAIAGGLTFGMFLLFGLGLYFQIEMMIASQDARNRFLGDAIAILDVRLREIEKLEETKANLLARMHVIQELQAIRPEVVHLFDEVVEAMPEGVFLTRMVQTGTNVVVEGRAQSNARVSALMRAIQASPWISDPQLLLIENKNQTGTGLSHFRLGFRQQRRDEIIPDGFSGSRVILPILANSQ
ncbi:MAG: pilus assembly protein PilN [Chromatiaceae bacterium]|nr:MAG: pilus assembly protein PilN [Chromatiaceae bacterium]